MDGDLRSVKGEWNALFLFFHHTVEVVLSYEEVAGGWEYKTFFLRQENLNTYYEWKLWDDVYVSKLSLSALVQRQVFDRNWECIDTRNSL